MAYNQLLADRLTEYFAAHTNVEVKKMFGGLCFMVSGHMCCGIVGDKLMARVGPENYENSLNQPHASKMDFTGKSMKGMIYVAPEGMASEQSLAQWVQLCEAFVASLPPMQHKP